MATLANSFVHSIEWYVFLRFIAGIGLAGELGVGVTLMAETVPKELRAYGSSLIICIGMLGAGVAIFCRSCFRMAITVLQWAVFLGTAASGFKDVEFRMLLFI